MKQKAILFLFPLVCSTSSFSQHRIERNQLNDTVQYFYKADTLTFSKPNLFRNLAKVPADLWYITKSPVQKRNWIGLTVVAASTAIFIAKDQEIINWVRNRSDDISLIPQTDYNILLKFGTTKIIKIPKNLNTALYQIGEGGTSMMLAGGLWIYGKIKKDWRAINTATDLAETFVTMGVTTQIIKRITGRESPFMATQSGGRWHPFPSFGYYQKNTIAYYAFPSGHLYTMMATVTVLSYNYPEKKWIKPVGYTLIGLSAFAMMNTEVHWAGDYPLAIAIGYLSGKVTTLRHRTKNKQIRKAIPL
jgi:membrane-associated phospholipid phosphatase